MDKINLRIIPFVLQSGLRPLWFLLLKSEHDLTAFRCAGAGIIRLRQLGRSYCHSRDDIEDSAYSMLENLPDEERLRCSDYLSINPQMEFPRYAWVAEPLLIEFEDGDALEIEALQEPEFCMTMNCIPCGVLSAKLTRQI